MKRLTAMESDNQGNRICSVDAIDFALGSGRTVEGLTTYTHGFRTASQCACRDSRVQGGADGNEERSARYGRIA